MAPVEEVRVSHDTPDIENLLNLFSDSGNLRRYTNTGDIQEGVRVLELDDSVTDTFVVTDIFDEGTRLDVDDSVWRIQFGLRYSFN